MPDINHGEAGYPDIGGQLTGILVRRNKKIVTLLNRGNTKIVALMRKPDDAGLRAGASTPEEFATQIKSN